MATREVTIYHTNGECPICGEPFNLDGREVDFDADERGWYAFQRVVCYECGCKFVDVYRLEHTEVWDEEKGE